MKDRSLLILDVHHPLCVSIAKVTFMRGAIMDLGLIEGISDLVRKHTGRKARDDFGHISFMRSVQDVVVNEYVVAEERKLR